MFESDTLVRNCFSDVVIGEESRKGFICFTSMFLRHGNVCLLAHLARLEFLIVICFKKRLFGWEFVCAGDCFLAITLAAKDV